MFLFMALPSGCRRAAPELRNSISMRRIRAARSARCDTIPTSAATPREQQRKAVQAADPPVKGVQRVLLTLYRDMTGRRGMSPEAAVRALSATDPFQNYPALVASLPVADVTTEGSGK